MLIEVESGTYTGRAHGHNGYFAGDFSETPFQWSRLYTQGALTRVEPATSAVQSASAAA